MPLRGVRHAGCGPHEQSMVAGIRNVAAEEAQRKGYCGFWVKSTVAAGKEVRNQLKQPDSHCSRPVCPSLCPSLCPSRMLCMLCKLCAAHCAIRWTAFLHVPNVWLPRPALRPGERQAPAFKGCMSRLGQPRPPALPDGVQPGGPPHVATASAPLPCRPYTPVLCQPTARRVA